MNVLKLLSAVTLAVMSMSLGAMANRPNFDLVNSYPKTAIYYRINDEQHWQVLNQAHHRATLNVPANGQINLALSASAIGTRPTYFSFSPQPAGIRLVRSKGPLTCYIQAHVIQPSMEVQIDPQNPHPQQRQNTRYGLPLTNNVTHQIIQTLKDRATTAMRTVTTTSTPAPRVVPAPVVPVPAPAPMPELQDEAQLRLAIEASLNNAPAPVVPAPAPALVIPALAQITTPTPASTTPVADQQVVTTAPVIPAPTPAPAPAPMPEVVTPAPAPIAEQAQDLIVAQLGLAGRRGLAGEFFMFFDMLNNLLSEAERTGRGGMLRDMLGNLTQATPAVREGFKDCAKHILELEESAMLPENNRINIIWRIFAPCVQENKHQIITNYIQRIYVSQPQYLAGVENLEALLAKFEQEMPADVQATWTTLQPIHKLFYIQFLRFFFAAQEVIARA